MSQTTVVNVRYQEPDVYIGRGGQGRAHSPWANPVHIAGDIDRDQAIAGFRSYFFDRLATEPAYAAATKALRGKTLGCFCKPATCHGDVIAAYVDSEMTGVKYWTGIGSRKTDQAWQPVMRAIAQRLSKWYVFRSGGAQGADQFFESGVGQLKDVILPDVGYAWLKEKFGMTPGVPLEDEETVYECITIVSSVLPEFHTLKPFAQKMHIRNVAQVLGRNLATPSKLVVYWAPEHENGVIEGGTRTAVYVARMYGIQTYNLALPGVYETLAGKLKLSA